MSDKGLITIYKQALLAQKAAQSMQTGHEKDSGVKHTGAGLMLEGVGGASPAAVTGSLNGPKSKLEDFHQSTISMHAECREAAIAAVCMEVASKGFEPLKDVLGLASW
jgi:hypothetical protein